MLARRLLFVLVSALGLSACGGASDSAQVTLQQAAVKDDHVGCAPAAFAPDGKADLHFRLTTSPSSIGDITAIDLVRSGSHAGVWTSGTTAYSLGVADTSRNQLIPSGETIKSATYSGTGLDLFACDDGATTAGDAFVVRVTLAGGRRVESAPVPYTAPK